MKVTQFVLEDSETGEVVGTSAIEAAVGLDDAFYHYHLSKAIHLYRVHLTFIKPLIS